MPAGKPTQKILLLKVSGLTAPHLPIKASDLSCFELTKCLLLILMGQAYSSAMLLLLGEGGHGHTFLSVQNETKWSSAIGVGVL